jgi:cobalamin biosynthesis Co2+ chelatase CbiK
MEEISSNEISSNGINVDTKTKGLKEIADIFDNYMKGMDAMSAKAYEKLDDSEEKK